MIRPDWLKVKNKNKVFKSHILGEFQESIWNQMQNCPFSLNLINTDEKEEHPLPRKGPNPIDHHILFLLLPIRPTNPHF